MIESINKFNTREISCTEFDKCQKVKPDLNFKIAIIMKVCTSFYECCSQIVQIKIYFSNFNNYLQYVQIFNFYKIVNKKMYKIYKYAIITIKYVQ